MAESVQYPMSFKQLQGITMLAIRKCIAIYTRRDCKYSEKHATSIRRAGEGSSKMAGKVCTSELEVRARAKGVE